ncbi:MAG: cytochrome c oxidase subunit II [Oculatellaceae cyanobacterium bins.114]|nr:cytochrome c oxidase subunit II [Oculatellaceae cyanobacterium bins.114]
MNIPSNILTMLAGISLTLVSIWYGQNHGLLPVAASEEASIIDGLFNTMMTVSVGLFLLVQGILVFALFKFRRRAGDRTDGPPIHGNLALEIVWTAIPAVVVLVIGVYSFEVYNRLGGFDPNAASDRGVEVAMLPGDNSSGLIDAPKPHKMAGHHHMALGIGAMPGEEGTAADLSVDVMGLQYAWIFTYPASGITTGELHVPVGKEVQLTIKAQDVIHAFWLPEFRLKQDAIPGRDAELRFRPQLVGEYPIVCAELCGPYHGAMGAKLFVHSPEDYDNWLQQQVASNTNPTQVVAMRPDDRSEADYLALIVEHLMGDSVAPEALAQLHPHHSTMP